MLFSTPTQFAVLALLLVAGWLFGLASHPGGRKWKARYLAERDAHAANRKDAETRIAAARTEAGTRTTDADGRIAELERENAQLRRAAPVTSQTVAPRAAATPAYPASTPSAHMAGERRGWFDWGRRSAR